MNFWSNVFNKIVYPLACLVVGITVTNVAAASPGPSHTTTGGAPLLELVFVIDNSGSMKITDPLIETRQAVKQFVGELSDQSRVGLVLFDEKVHQLYPLHTIYNPQNEMKFLSSLEQLNYNGRYTNGPGGIERAIYDFKTNGRPESQKAIIFITDGIVTSSSKLKKQDLIQWLKQDLVRELQLLKIRVYGVAVAETADIALIQALASRTDGDYFRARDASEISSALERISTFLSPKIQSPQIAEPVPVPAPASDPVVLPASISQVPAPIKKTAYTKRPAGFEPKSSWLFHLCLALSTVLLVATVVVLFTKYKRLQSGPTVKPKAVPPLMDIPRAWLQDKNLDDSAGAVIFNLDKAVISIGRGAQNDLCIPQATISMRHATIEYKTTAFYLSDLESTNGTSLNKDKLRGYESVPLKNGDTIWFGELQYKFEMPDPDQSLFMKTVMLESTSSNRQEDPAPVTEDEKPVSEQEGLAECLKNHLVQIEAIGPKYESFVSDHFHDDILNALISEGEQNLNKTANDHQLHHSTYVKNKIFYLVCTLPVEISEAVNWYRDQYGSFIKFVHQWINDDAYQSANCDSICIVTFGKASAHWVSVTIVPTQDESDDAVEIISVDFLSDEEKAMLPTQ